MSLFSGMSADASADALCIIIHKKYMLMEPFNEKVHNTFALESFSTQTAVSLHDRNSYVLEMWIYDSSLHL